MQFIPLCNNRSLTVGQIIPINTLSSMQNHPALYIAVEKQGNTEFYTSFPQRVVAYAFSLTV